MSPTSKPIKREKSEKIAKERLTVHVPVDVIDQVKNSVFWTPGLTLSDLAERAFRDAVYKLEKKSGKRFPHRTSDLKGGRPMK